MGLPSHFDPDWLSRSAPDIAWRCKACYWTAKAKMNDKEAEIVIERRYLIKLRELVPALSSVAAIVMICLEIAWHTS
jgi:hypothetical protein